MNRSRQYLVQAAVGLCLLAGLGFISSQSSARGPCYELDKKSAMREGVVTYSWADNLHGGGGFLTPGTFYDAQKKDLECFPDCGISVELNEQSGIFSKLETLDTNGDNVVDVHGQWYGQIGQYDVKCEHPILGTQMFEITEVRNPRIVHVGNEF